MYGGCSSVHQSPHPPGRGGVEGGLRRAPGPGHRRRHRHPPARRPHMTRPPPRLIRRAPTSLNPASRHSSPSGEPGPAVEGVDAGAEEPPDLVPLPAPGHEPRHRQHRPGVEPPGVHQNGLSGSPNSRLATGAPGRTTRASSDRVARGSAT